MSHATRLLGVLSLLICLMPLPFAQASGIPVIDVSNLGQTTVTALESVSQTLKQLEEYTLQLQQFEDQIKNSIAPAAYVWSQAQKTMAKVLALQEQLNAYMSITGNIDAHLSTFGNIANYNDAPYFKTGSATDRAALMASEKTGSEAQKIANDTMIRTIEQQQAALRDDASTLEELQTAAQTSQGWLEAIQYTNQIAAHQSGQLLQLRALLMAQQQAEAARNQTLSAREARQQAADEKALESRYTESPKVDWFNSLR